MEEASPLELTDQEALALVGKLVIAKDNDGFKFQNVEEEEAVKTFHITLLHSYTLTELNFT